MLKFFFALILSCAGLAAHADQTWDATLAKILASPLTVQVQTGEVRYLELSDSDKSVSHKASYLSVIGNYDAQGNYVPEQAAGVDEDWQTDAPGHWIIDQWLYYVSVDGQLTGVEHRQLEEQDGQVLNQQDLPAGSAQSAENQARWMSLLGRF